MKEFKIRASQLGKLMTRPRSKKETLSETAKTYLKELAIENIYGFKKEFSNKYTRKGISQEDKSILRLSNFEDEFYVKNEKHFSEGFLSGTPDIVTDSEVIDIKTSWNATTFPIWDNELKNKVYYWQLVAYMMLTGLSNARLVYILEDTPEEEIQDEIRRLSYQRFEIEISDETENEVREQHDFSVIPDNKRIKIFNVELTDDAIKEVEEKLKEAETYYNELVSKLK